jgi:hypothetical protein
VVSGGGDHRDLRSQHAGVPGQPSRQRSVVPDAERRETALANYFDRVPAPGLIAFGVAT